LVNVKGGDDRFFNNIFAGGSGLAPYDKAVQPVAMDGNVFLKEAQPSKHEKEPLLKPDVDPALQLVEKPDGFHLEHAFDKAWTTERRRAPVTTERLGKAAIPGLPYERPDGTPLRIDTDYFGKPRSASNPTPGPFEDPGSGRITVKVR
jgi:alpha-N-arabinofuranosidase